MSLGCQKLVHVRKMPLKSNLEARYAWLIWDKAEMLDMSDQSLWNPAMWPNMPALTGVFGVWPRGRTYLARVSEIQLGDQICLT
jgi:hypothetical protein